MLGPIPSVLSVRRLLPMPAPSILLVVAFALLAPSAHAQQRVIVSELDAAFDVPSDWSSTREYTVFDHLPTMGLYNLMNLETGAGIGVRRDECAAASRRRAWTAGRIAGELHPRDALTPLDAGNPTSFADHAGFRLDGARGDVDYSAYLYYLTRGTGCYEITLWAPADLLDQSTTAFQSILGSLQIGGAD